MKNVLVMSMVVLVFVAGCQQPTLNEQRSALRGSADFGSTELILRKKMTKEDVAMMKEILNEIEKFINDGQVADLTTGALRTELDKIVAKYAPKYQPVVAWVLAAVSGITVDTQKIGPDNVARIKAALMGAHTGCNQYVFE